MHFFNLPKPLICLFQLLILTVFTAEASALTAMGFEKPLSKKIIDLGLSPLAPGGAGQIVLLRL